MAAPDEPQAPGTDHLAEDPTLRPLYKAARTWVYERMALLTAVIWAGGAAILMATIVPYVPYPQSYIAIACVIPMAPAALPWLFYSRLSKARLSWVVRHEAGQKQPPE